MVAAAGIVLLSLLCVLQAAGNPDARPAPIILPQAISPDDSDFESLFDGKSLKGWTGDPTYWRMENGSIVGEVTPETTLERNNSFIIWQGEELADFELKLRYRITPDGNSGINYRSEALVEPKWTMRGYQFDIDGAAWGRGFATFLREAGIQVPAPPGKPGMVEVGESLRVTGQNYDERGRHILALPGQLTHVGSGQVQRVVAHISDGDLIDQVANDGWNEVHIIARGNLLIHLLNGQLVSEVIDDDTKNRRLAGKLGMQVHVGPPMKVEFREIRLKRL
jgi:hypothetical protein